MSIGKKLYINFVIILGMVVMLFFVTWYAVHREQGTKEAAAEALRMKGTTDHIQFEIMQNRLYLGNYLLSGDSREIERMIVGIQDLTQSLDAAQKMANTDQQRSALETVKNNENSWFAEFAQPLMQKRKDVDAGNATVADLQIFYLQKDAGTWVKNSTDALNIADHETQHELDERQEEDKNA